ncbi:MAG TPA: hypothetical protein VGU03_11025 [Frateuria sp.]|uniref:hypothetical protein n=1 Tax=Frateuria sp. TaxID=2211372 RepID=UPI002DEA5180|nr:hypothetical protein [Frateuria sp.]
MSAVSTDLNLRVRRPLRTIPEPDLAKLSSEARAVQYACENSGLQDKSIAIEIGVDPAVLSKAKAGQARLNDEALDALMDATGIEAPLFALLLRRGYDPRSLRRFETDVERENRQLRERLSSLETEREIERRTIRELMGARA